MSIFLLRSGKRKKKKKIKIFVYKYTNPNTKHIYIDVNRCILLKFDVTGSVAYAAVQRGGGLAALGVANPVEDIGPSRNFT